MQCIRVEKSNEADAARCTNMQPRALMRTPLLRHPGELHMRQESSHPPATAFDYKRYTERHFTNSVVAVQCVLQRTLIIIIIIN